MKIKTKFVLLVGCLILPGATYAVASLTVQTASTYLRSLSCTSTPGETTPGCTCVEWNNRVTRTGE